MPVAGVRFVMEQNVEAQMSEPGVGRNTALSLGIGARLCMLIINYWPVMHAALVIGVLVVAWGDVKWRIAASLIMLLILPPVVAGILRGVFPIRKSKISLGQRDFIVWWILFNLQVVFCRFPAIEEALRLIPGLYSFWLRMWGAKIGRLTYWGAGLRILDRSFLVIGNDVLFGAAVRINPHVMMRSKTGEIELILAPVIIGNNAIVGGYSLLTAGTEIAEGECTRAFLVSPPFSHWRQGVRISKPDLKT